jgi:hypothetical protein
VPQCGCPVLTAHGEVSVAEVTDEERYAYVPYMKQTRHTTCRISFISHMQVFICNRNFLLCISDRAETPRVWGIQCVCVFMGTDSNGAA